MCNCPEYLRLKEAFKHAEIAIDACSKISKNEEKIIANQDILIATMKQVIEEKDRELVNLKAVAEQLDFYDSINLKKKLQ